ncbi:iron-chelator utilization protein [Cronobacter sakazakii 696]|nr:iron-chelator utilization protein [Cronobacter sakazakii 696]
MVVRPQQAFLEVPLAQDIQPLRYPFADIHWLARDENAAHGERLLEAVKDAVTLPVSEQVSAQMTEDDDEETRWCKNPPNLGWRRRY